METKNINAKETLLKAGALITGLLIAAFAIFVVFVHPGNIN
jgi:hypothetical protein